MTAYKQKRKKMRNISNVTLYDIMANETEIWLKKNKKDGYDLQISIPDGDIEIDETQIHEYAIDSMAEFCRRFLHDYDLANKGE